MILTMKMLLIKNKKLLCTLVSSHHQYSSLANAVFHRIKENGVIDGMNLIAFSGGVDSSVVSYAVNVVFPGNTKAVLGKSSSLPLSQLAIARSVAKEIGIDLVEIETKEGLSEQYVSNEGMSCYSCKVHLYSGLKDVYNTYKDSIKPDANNSKNVIVMYNGTNADDRLDETRVGLMAANEFNVVSPIDHLTKNEVRALAREFNLSNHNFAASPCLRSRLQYGVHATSDNLKRIEEAENIVKLVLGPVLKEETNMRVRHLKNSGARLELDEHILDELIKDSVGMTNLSNKLIDLGYSHVNFGAFRRTNVTKIDNV